MRISKNNIYTALVFCVASLLLGGPAQADNEVTLENAKAQTEAGQFRKAGIIYQRLMRQFPQSLEIRRGLANNYFSQQRLPEAEKLLNEVLVDYPGDAESWKLLAQVQILRNDFPGAVRSLEQALYFEPDNPRTLAELGQARSQMGDQTGAEAAYQAHDELVAPPTETP